MIRVGLRGEGIVKRFGRIAALRGVDFEIEAGESVAILGANGAGKSTLLRILAGLSRPSEGRFEALAMSGNEVSGNSPAAAPLAREIHRAGIGYVGHATLLYGELTAAENLRFAARLAGTLPDPTRIRALLRELDLEDVAERRAGTFSRGMSQRLAIARAIVHEPKILLLDEPFTGLDELSAESLSEGLARLRQGGRTIVLITHDPRRAVELTNRALILHRGRIVERPGVESVYETDALRASLARCARESGREDAA